MQCPAWIADKENLPNPEANALTEQNPAQLARAPPEHRTEEGGKSPPQPTERWLYPGLQRASRGGWNHTNHRCPWADAKHERSWPTRPAYRWH